MGGFLSSLKTGNEGTENRIETIDVDPVPETVLEQTVPVVVLEPVLKQTVPETVLEQTVPVPNPTVELAVNTTLSVSCPPPECPCPCPPPDCPCPSPTVSNMEGEDTTDTVITPVVEVVEEVVEEVVQDAVIPPTPIIEVPGTVPEVQSSNKKNKKRSHNSK